MIPTLAQLDAIAGTKVDRANADSVLEGLRAFPTDRLDEPFEVAQYLAQIMHESGRFRYDEEVWGPTAAQRRYDTRTDLGNTAAVDGDGHKYRGMTGIQRTGKANYEAFYDWAYDLGLNPPDFVSDPEKILTDPWEGLSPIHYWITSVPAKYVDEGNVEMVSRRVNGGTNGLEDRLNLYTRAALVLLGYNPTDVRGFQGTVKGMKVDGAAGPLTRAALHSALKAMPMPAPAGGWGRPTDAAWAPEEPEPDVVKLAPGSYTLHIGAGGAEVRKG